MSQTLTIPDDLYTRLETTARQHGLPTVQQLLEVWLANEAARNERSQIVQQIDALRDRLFATYGEMPDSTELIREDRAR